MSVSQLDDAIKDVTTDSASDYMEAAQADSAKCLAAAREYAAMGWSVIPLCHASHVGVWKNHLEDCSTAGKTPTAKWKVHQTTAPTIDMIEEWWKDNIRNVGLVLGPVSGRLLRVDVDGEAGVQAWRDLIGNDPPQTLSFRRGELSRGLLFHVPDGVELRTTREPFAVGEHQELRLQWAGAYTVVPPSRHKSGERYEWEPGCSPWQIEAAEAPKAILDAMRCDGGKVGRNGTGGKRGRASPIGEKIKDGTRNDTLASLAGVMRRKGMSEEAIEAALAVENAARCEPPLADAVVATIARSIGKYPPTADAFEAAAEAEKAERQAEDALGAATVVMDGIEDARDALEGDGLAAIVVVATADMAKFEAWLLDKKYTFTTEERTAIRRAVKARVKEAKAEAAKEKVRAREYGDRPSDRFMNYREEEIADDEGKVKIIHIGKPIGVVGDELLARTGGWPKRARHTLFARTENHNPRLLESTASTFAWIAAQLPQSGDSKLVWGSGRDMPSQDQFIEHLKATVERFDDLAVYPHHPLIQGYYYCHPPVRGGDGKALHELLDHFRPASLVDRDLLLSLLMTMVWGGRPGQRPAFLLEGAEGNKQGGVASGKTTIATKLAQLVGGVISANPEDKISDLITRILSPGAAEQRCVIVDNIKNLELSWGALEGLITTSWVSGRELYYGEGRRPNNLLYLLTCNGASLSTDLASRTVTIQIGQAVHDPDWLGITDQMIEGRRWEILGDLVAILKKPTTRLDHFSRWATWEQEVLAHVGNPSECQRVIAERQGKQDGNKNTATLIEQVVRQWLDDHEFYLGNPEKAKRAFPGGSMAEHRLSTLDMLEIVGRTINATSIIWVGRILERFEQAFQHLKKSTPKNVTYWTWTPVK